MIRHLKTFGFAALLSLCASIFFTSAQAMNFVETPFLKADVAANKLPPVEIRVPQNPRVIDLAETGRTPGKHGGTLRMLMGRSKDIRMLTVYGYARLVAYDEKYNIIPDILESFDIEENRIFTLHLRPGHKWSDGHPFTSEDFRYFWEDVALHETLSKGTIHKALLVDKQPPKFEVIDELTVRYTWEGPNPEFLTALAYPRPLYIYRPAHYLKPYHEKYADIDKLNAAAKADGKRNWAAVHRRISRQYRPQNPDLPSLQPWHNTTRPPADRFVFVRNAFFHRVDTVGQQLPYIDKVTIDMSSSKIIPTKTGAGESDLQARYIRFNNYTFLKQAEKLHGFKVHLWRQANGSNIALYPSLNTKDKVWQPLNRDVRFRRALSLGIDRHEVNQVIFYGLANESSNTMLPGYELYKKEYQDAWARFDLVAANKLLDEIGLTKRGKNNLRLLPNGEPMEIIVETSGDKTEQIDALELIKDSWAKLGIKMVMRATQRDVFRSRVQAGSSVMSIWSGIENGIATPDMSPSELAPTSGEQLQWPFWGNHFQTGGRSGIEPTDPGAIELLALYGKWRLAPDRTSRAEIWHKMLKIFADQVYTIGVVNSNLQPVVVGKNLRNVPEKGMFTWDPGAYFGIYLMDTFWLEEDAG